jgi:CRISPR system Cascade subunit CasA
VRGPADATAWEELWRTEGLPVDDVVRYLETWRHRFDLFSAEEPFLQVTGLTTRKGEVSGLEKLIADVPNGHPYFTTRSGADLTRIGPAEAARWLVHAQGFDPSGIKSGAVGDEARVQNGKGYPIGIAWAGNLGGVLLQGTTLRDTLLLNLLPYQDAEMDWGPPHDDLPVWERPRLTAAVELADGIPRRRPRGPADLYTWPSRRIRLAGSVDAVTGVLIANGDPLEPQNRHRVEPMTAWRRSTAQEKKRGEPLVYMPKEHSTERAFWRGLAALLPYTTRSVQSADPARFRSPGVVDWLEYAHRYAEIVPVDYPVRLRAAGLVYGSNNSVVAELIDDELSLSVAVMRASQPELGQEAVRAVSAAEHAVTALSRLAANLAAAGGRDGEGAGARAAELGYAALDMPFRRWLAGLRSDSVLHEIEEDWHRRVARIVRDLAGDLLESAGASAWKGREVNKRHLDAALADIFFDNELRKAVPRAFAEPAPAAR